MKEDKINYGKEAVIDKINLINTEKAISYYDKKFLLLTNIKMSPEKTPAKYWKYRFQLEKLADKRNSLYVKTKYYDTNWLIKDVIEKALSYVVSIKNNNNLNKILNPFINESLNLNESFMREVDILKKKVGEGIVEAEEIQQDIKNCENKYKKIIVQKVYLFNKLKFYVSICNGDVDICLRQKISNTIVKLRDILNKNI